MPEKMTTKNDSFLPGAMIEILDRIENNQENRSKFEQYYKSFVLSTSKIAINNQNEELKRIVKESEVFSMLIREKTRDFGELSKEAYAMGRFAGAYDAFNTWCKMFSDNTEFEQIITKELLKKHVSDILYCVKEQPGIQNKKILENVKIKPNYLSELTSELIYHQILNRYSVGKNTFYELTPRAKEFFVQKERKEEFFRNSRRKVDMYILFDEYIGKSHDSQHNLRRGEREWFVEEKKVRNPKIYKEDVFSLERSVYNV